MSDLVERVGLAIGNCSCVVACPTCETEARAAIAVCMEEAARVAEEAAANTAYPDDFIVGYNGACEDIAAAIRAMIPKEGE